MGGADNAGDKRFKDAPREEGLSKLSGEAFDAELQKFNQRREAEWAKEWTAHFGEDKDKGPGKSADAGDRIVVVGKKEGDKIVLTAFTDENKVTWTLEGDKWKGKKEDNSPAGELPKDAIKFEVGKIGDKNVFAVSIEKDGKRITYDSRGPKLTEILDGDGETIGQIFEDKNKLVRKIVDAEGNKWLFKWDAEGKKVTLVTGPGGIQFDAEKHKLDLAKLKEGIVKFEKDGKTFEYSLNASATITDKDKSKITINADKSEVHVDKDNNVTAVREAADGDTPGKLYKIERDGGKIKRVIPDEKDAKPVFEVGTNCEAIEVNPKGVIVAKTKADGSGINTSLFPDRSKEVFTAAEKKLERTNSDGSIVTTKDGKFVSSKDISETTWTVVKDGDKIVSVKSSRGQELKVSDYGEPKFDLKTGDITFDTKDKKAAVSMQGVVREGDKLTLLRKDGGHTVIDKNAFVEMKDAKGVVWKVVKVKDDEFVLKPSDGSSLPPIPLKGKDAVDIDRKGNVIAHRDDGAVVRQGTDGLRTIKGTDESELVLSDKNKWVSMKDASTTTWTLKPGPGDKGLILQADDKGANKGLSFQDFDPSKANYRKFSFDEKTGRVTLKDKDDQVVGAINPDGSLEKVEGDKVVRTWAAIPAARVELGDKGKLLSLTDGAGVKYVVKKHDKDGQPEEIERTEPGKASEKLTVATHGKMSFDKDTCSLSFEKANTETMRLIDGRGVQSVFEGTGDKRKAVCSLMLDTKGRVTEILNQRSQLTEATVKLLGQEFKKPGASTEIKYARDAKSPPGPGDIEEIKNLWQLKGLTLKKEGAGYALYDGTRQVNPPGVWDAQPVVDGGGNLILKTPDNKKLSFPASGGAPTEVDKAKEPPKPKGTEGEREKLPADKAAAAQARLKAFTDKVQFKISDLEPKGDVFHPLRPPGFAGITPGEAKAQEKDKPVYTRELVGEPKTNPSGSVTAVYKGKTGDVGYQAKETYAGDKLVSSHVKYDKPISLKLQGKDDKPVTIPNVVSVTTWPDPKTGKYVTLITDASGRRFSASTASDGKVEGFQEVAARRAPPTMPPGPPWYLRPYPTYMPPHYGGHPGYYGGHPGYYGGHPGYYGGHPGYYGGHPGYYGGHPGYYGGHPGYYGGHPGGGIRIIISIGPYASAYMSPYHTGMTYHPQYGHVSHQQMAELDARTAAYYGRSAYGSYRRGYPYRGYAG